MSIDVSPETRALATYLVAELRAELWVSCWSHSQLAEATGIPTHRIRAAMNLRGKPITVDELYIICRVLDVDMVALCKRAELAAGAVLP